MHSRSCRQFPKLPDIKCSITIDKKLVSKKISVRTKKDKNNQWFIDYFGLPRTNNGKIICMEENCENLSYVKKGETSSLYCRKHRKICSKENCKLYTFGIADQCLKHLENYQQCRFNGGYVCLGDAKDNFCPRHTCYECPNESIGSNSYDDDSHYPCREHTCECKERYCERGHACCKYCEFACQKGSCSWKQGSCPIHSSIVIKPVFSVCGFINCMNEVDIDLENYTGRGRCPEHVDKDPCQNCSAPVKMGTRFCQIHFCETCKTYREYLTEEIRTCDSCQGLQCKECEFLVHPHYKKTELCLYCHRIQTCDLFLESKFQESTLKKTIIRILRENVRDGMIPPISNIWFEKTVGDGSIRLDILVEMSVLHLAIEIDEDSHENYSIEYEAARPFIVNKFYKNLAFLRVGTNNLFEQRARNKEHYKTIKENISEAIQDLTNSHIENKMLYKIINYSKHRKRELEKFMSSYMDE